MDEKSVIILTDDTVIPLVFGTSTEDFARVEPLLNYIIYSKPVTKSVAKTSQKIWNEFKESVGGDSETYQYARAVFGASNIACSDEQDYEQTMVDLISVYSKEYELVILVSDRDYTAFDTDGGDVIHFKIDDFGKFAQSDKDFTAFLEDTERLTGI